MLPVRSRLVSTTWPAPTEGSTLSSPQFRVIVRADELTLLPRRPYLITDGPQSNLLRGPERAGVTVADLHLHTVRGQHELVLRFHTHAPTDAQTEQLAGWGARVGHRRMWVNEEVIDLQSELPDVRPVGTMCPCCAARWVERSWEFWSGVVGRGHFPIGCPVCGGFLPQWAPEPDAEGSAWEALHTTDAEGGWE